MQRNRVFIAFGIAWLTALALSWWVYRTSTAPQSRDAIRIVAATRDLPVGKRVDASDLKLISIDRKDLPKGAMQKTADAVDRAVAVAMSAGETVLATKLAAKGTGEGLPALIEPGMRAVSVPVNEISGVSGFIQPSTRVDVLFTRTFSNGDAATTTILQNVKVIAYGRQLDPAAKIDPRDAKPSVATLLVTQVEAEKVVLAAQRGRIQLVLRNTLDDRVTSASTPVQSADLGIQERARGGVRNDPPPVRRVVVPPAPAAPPKPVEPEEWSVRIYRGDKVVEQTFKGNH
jgi:pilus assembly protein CpaB